MANYAKQPTQPPPGTGTLSMPEVVRFMAEAPVVVQSGRVTLYLADRPPGYLYASYADERNNDGDTADDRKTALPAL